MSQRNVVANKLEVSSRGHRNCLRVSVGNSDEHESAKFEVLMWLRRHGLAVITEAEFKGKTGRCDLLVLDWNIAVEIIFSESEEAAMKKNYPVKEIVLIDPFLGLKSQVKEKLAWRV